MLASHSPLEKGPVNHAADRGHDDNQNAVNHGLLHAHDRAEHQHGGQRQRRRGRIAIGISAPRGGAILALARFLGISGQIRIERLGEISGLGKLAGEFLSAHERLARKFLPQPVTVVARLVLA